MGTIISRRVHYKKGYKYQLFYDMAYQTDITGYRVMSRYLYLDTDGTLTIKGGYCWDGASGPTIDTKNFMEGSLVHDVLYQLMRMDLLPQKCREYADDRLKADCIRDGMSKFRARYVHWGVNLGAKAAANPKNKRKIFTAP